MIQYLDLLKDIRYNGVDKSDRTGTGTKSVFGRQMRFDLQKGFPLLTTKKLHLKSIIHELLWLLKGETNIKYLTDNGVRIWNEWADENGDLGPIYGEQWRNFNNQGVDQIKELTELLKNDPDSRRMIVNAWNPTVLPLPIYTFAENVQHGRSALPPCHMFFQCYVANNKVSLQIYVRSNDIFLGAPFNIASYALLTMMLAQVSGFEPGDLVFTIGDAHIYNNHLEQVDLQLSRFPRKLPTMVINPFVDNIFDFKFEDFSLDGYNPLPHIKGKVSI